MNKKKEYPVGTLVLKTSLEPMYGIVINYDFWITEVKKHDPEDIAQFLKYNNENGFGFMIPILYFGDIIGTKMVNDGDVIKEVPYVQRYGYSNIGGDIHIIAGGTKEILWTTWQMLQFFGNKVTKYINEVRQDINALLQYLKGGYDLESSNISFYNKGMIRLYEKALPGLAGSQKNLK